MFRIMDGVWIVLTLKIMCSIRVAQDRGCLGQDLLCEGRSLDLGPVRARQACMIWPRPE